MAEIKYILVLANSDRERGRCIAGKIAKLMDDGNFDVGQQWIRLNDPKSTTGGAVPYGHTLCRPPNRTAIRPLDFIKVTLLGPCNNPDHPEDWNYDPNVPLEWAGSANHDCLASVVDTPPTLWHDGYETFVRAGYIRTMPEPASLYLIKAPKGFSLQYYKEWFTAETGNYFKKRQRLKFVFTGKSHDFSVSDPDFERRFKLPSSVSQRPETPTNLTIEKPDDAYFCLSLTGLTPPKYTTKHFKMCATIFQS